MRSARTVMNVSGQLHEIYQVVKAASPIGLTYAEVCRRFPHTPARQVQVRLHDLRSTGFVRLLAKGQPYVVDDTCKTPVMREPKQPRSILMTLLRDCPAGMSLQALIDDSQLSSAMVTRTMLPEVASGRVLNIEMPEAHGGGIGYRLAPEVTGMLMDANEAAAPAPARTPKVFGDGCNFMLSPNGRFHIESGDLQLTLPAHVTRAMFRHLDQLGGLNLQRHLPAAEGGAS